MAKLTLRKSEVLGEGYDGLIAIAVDVKFFGTMS
jgi:hypothetical protein